MTTARTLTNLQLYNRRADEERAAAVEAGTAPAVSQLGGAIPAGEALDW